MKIAVSTDAICGAAQHLIDELTKRGHELILCGAFSQALDESADWAWASERAALAVAKGDAEQGIVCCWTGTGASIAANKVTGIRAALCADAPTAAGARKWNDANVLAISLRVASEAMLDEILDAWFTTEPSTDSSDVANVAHLEEMAGADYTFNS